VVRKPCVLPSVRMKKERTHLHRTWSLLSCSFFFPLPLPLPISLSLSLSLSVSLYWPLRYSPSLFRFDCAVLCVCVCVCVFVYVCWCLCVICARITPPVFGRTGCRPVLEHARVLYPRQHNQVHEHPAKRMLCCIVCVRISVSDAWCLWCLSGRCACIAEWASPTCWTLVERLVFVNSLLTACIPLGSAYTFTHACSHSHSRKITYSFTHTHTHTHSMHNMLVPRSQTLTVDLVYTHSFGWPWVS
jgi:hypothetical protein